jgi:hypothetical protein
VLKIVPEAGESAYTHALMLIAFSESRLSAIIRISSPLARAVSEGRSRSTKIVAPKQASWPKSGQETNLALGYEDTRRNRAQGQYIDITQVIADEHPAAGKSTVDIDGDADPSHCSHARPVQPFRAAMKGYGTVKPLGSKLEASLKARSDQQEELP